MWGRQRTPRAPLPSEDKRSGRLITRAFREFAGTNNGVVYDVPRDSRPEAIPDSIFVRGSPAWRSYLDARELADVGQPAILFALRVLDDPERNLAVDWGTTYPNTFFLVEPHDRSCDLSDPANRFTQRVNDAIKATLRLAPADTKMPDGWTNATPLGSVLREIFGTWVYWIGPQPYREIQHVELTLRSAEDTLWGTLQPELDARFPQPVFDRALAYVNDWERELLGGPVTRARSVFRTRLGMPILADSRCVDRALRRLVNEGRITVVGTTLPGHPVFGRERPVPEEISDEEFAGFLMR